MRSKRIKRKKIKKYLTILLIALVLGLFIYAFKVIEYRCNIRITEIRNNAKNGVKMPIKEEVVEEPIKKAEPIKKVEVKTIDNKIDDRELLARLLYTEARGESIECQRAVVSVVLNRVNTSGNTISEVIKAPGQFDLGNKLDNIKPLQTQYDVVDYVLANGITIPSDVIYFRSGHFHSFAEDYKQIGNMYFSR